MWNSSNVTIDNVTTLYAKDTGVTSVDSNNLEIINSKFINSYLYGLVVYSGGIKNARVRIENNLIKDTKANGLLISNVVASKRNPAIIRGNLFIHNHKENLWNLCGPSDTEPCSGGQIYIDVVKNLNIEDNVFRDGSSDTNPGVKSAYGIEINNLNNININIDNNDIHNHTGSAVFFNPDPVNVKNVSITGNKFYDNGLNPNFNGANITTFPIGEPADPSMMTESNNCYTSTCKTMINGKIYAEPNPCYLSGQPTCTSVIKWVTNDVTSPSVMVSNQLFSTSTSDSQPADWINDQGDTFDLLSGADVLDKVFVIGAP